MVTKIALIILLKPEVFNRAIFGIENCLTKFRCIKPRQFSIKKLMFLTIILIFIILIAGCKNNIAQETQKNQTPLPPSKPSYDYFCKNFTENLLGAGTSEKYDDYYVFIPSYCKKTLTKAPVVVLLHGWGSPNIENSRDWIEHLAKKGNIVIFPVYEERSLENIGRGDWSLFVDRTADAIKNGIDWLKSDENRVQPDTEEFAIAGGSMGAYITINLVSAWREKNLPEPKIIMLIHPPQRFLLEDVKNPENIPPNVLLSCFVGEDDNIAGRYGCDAVWNITSSVKKREYIFECSDNHGEPKIRAGHAPTSGDYKVIEWYAYWKTLDALMDCAFYNKNCDEGLGDTPEHRYMGKWSDGVKVKELIIRDNPPEKLPC